MDSILSTIATWWPVVTSFVGTFALIATITPNKSDDKIVDMILKVVNFLGGNLGKARNQDG